MFLKWAFSFRYLHEVCLPSVVHRNFKSANILLDEELNPHLSDCGLAALNPNTERQVLKGLQHYCDYSHISVIALVRGFQSICKIGGIIVIGPLLGGGSIFLGCGLLGKSAKAMKVKMVQVMKAESLRTWG